MMREVTEQLINEVDEFMKMCMEKAMEDIDITDINVEEFVAMQKAMKLMETSKELALKQAIMMDEMDRKLDMLLAKIEEKA